MARSHPLIEARQLEYEFEKVFRGFEQRKKEPEYAQDVEFFRKLEELRGKYGYSLGEVVDLLVNRYVGSVEALSGGVGSINTKAVKQLVDIYADQKEPTLLAKHGEDCSRSTIEQAEQ